MTTVQAVVYAIVQGFSSFLPISSDAHQVLLPFLTRWSPPDGPLEGALAMGCLLSLLIYFRHDWASMISCFLQVILFRKRPMTLDERLPFFILIATLPLGIVSYYLGSRPLQWQPSPMAVAIALGAFGAPLWLADSLSRKSKGMFDWNWIDSSIVGVLQVGTLVTGLGPLTATLTAALFRNYNREAAIKFAFFAMAPILGAEAFRHLHQTDFHAAMPMPSLSWLSFGVALVVTFFVGLLAIGGLMKQIQHKGMGQYVAYRWVFALGCVALLFYRGRHGA